jgi:medium-chain acyl-[acyl-carrier-protein] hydrolase
VEVCPVQLPGRESRLREPPLTRLEPLVPALLEGLSPFLDLPFAFFGHSMGALIAFELAHELARRGASGPRHLFVSARRAPRLPSREGPIANLPEPEFLVHLRELNGTPEEVLAHAELMELLLPLLRADFALHESFVYRAAEPLAVGISAFGGLADPDVTREDLAGWREETRGSFGLRMLPGDHFFIHSATAMITEAVARDLAELELPAERREPGEKTVAS